MVMGEAIGDDVFGKNKSQRLYCTKNIMYGHIALLAKQHYTRNAL